MVNGYTLPTFVGDSCLPMDGVADLVVQPTHLNLQLWDDSVDVEQGLLVGEHLVDVVHHIEVRAV